MYYDKIYYDFGKFLVSVLKKLVTVHITNPLLHRYRKKSEEAYYSHVSTDNNFLFTGHLFYCERISRMVNEEKKFI